MSEKIDWTLNVQVEKGPTIAASAAVTVDAYDKIGIEVPAQATKTVEVQPGGEGQVQFLVINSDWFGDLLTYKVNGKDAISLDALHVLIGDGAVGLLGAPPKTLEIANKRAQAPANAPANTVNIEVFVGRKAI